MRKFLQIFLSAIFILPVSVSAAGIPQFHFENITTANGLSSNEVTCLYQDHDGFLWIGTHFGLNRYDGNEVQTFYHETGNPNSLSGNDIVQIIQDRENIFWIATKDGGLTRYDPSKMVSNQFQQFQNNPSDKYSIATNRLTCLYDYSSEYLLVGAEVCTGFFIDKKSFQIKYVNLRPISNSLLDPSKALASPSTFHNWIHHISGNDSTIYISFLIGSYVYQIDRKKGAFNLSLTATSESAALSIPDFIVDGGKAWLAAWKPGLMIQDKLFTDTLHIPVQKKVLSVNDEITCFEAWDENFMLAGSKATGLYIVNKKDYSYENLRRDRIELHSLASNKINCILKDRDGILWIGTSDGLSKYNPIQWQFHEVPLTTFEDKELTHYSIDDDDFGTLRVCTSEGVFKKTTTDKSFYLVHYKDQGLRLSPTYIFKSNDGDHYLCTERSFYKYDPENETLAHTPVEQFDNNPELLFYSLTMQFRFALADTIEGRPFLVLAVLGDGLSFYDLSNHQLLNMVNDPEKRNSISDNLIHIIVKDHDGNLWVGTANGLCKWNKSYPLENSFVSYLNVPEIDSTISSNNITGIFVDADNHLWITTNSNGLNEFDGKIFHHYFTAHTRGNNMLGIYADNKNRFWIPTSEGFDVFDRNTRAFDEVSIPNPEWILKYPSRILKKSDGTFCYGASNYVISFDPDSYSFEHSSSNVYLTDFKVMDKSIFKTKSFSDLNFPYDKNFFTINFSSLQLSKTSPVEYQYKLDGLNEDWVNVGSKGAVSFTSLPSGHYDFKVRVAAVNGSQNGETSLLSFTVRKPFWLMWWFFLLCAALVSLALYVVFRIRLHQLMRLQEIRHRIATDLHDDIGSALSSISIGTQLVKKFSHEDDEKVNRLLNRINTTSSETLDSMSDIVWAINPKNDSGKNMVMKMQRVASDLLESKGIKVHFEYDDDFERMKLGMEGRKNLFLIFKEAVNNISKHSASGIVNISLKSENHHLSMRIEDDGRGFVVTKSLLGNGMDSMKHRSEQIGGELLVKSEEGTGTKIILNVDLTRIRD